jgi:hypothetical protein
MASIMTSYDNVFVAVMQMRRFSFQQRRALRLELHRLS